MAESPTFHGFLNKIGLNSAAGWSWAFGVSGIGMILGLVNFVLRRKLVEDVSLPAGTKEAEPKGLWFVAVMILTLLGMAWVVVGAKAWYIQLLLGAVGAASIMIISQMLVNRGLIPTRATAQITPGGTPEHHELSTQDRNRLMVVGVMLLFSISFWFVFQQAGSTLSLFAKDYTKRVIGNPEAAQIQVTQGNLGTEYRPALNRLTALDEEIFRKGSRTLQDVRKIEPAKRPADLALSNSERQMLETYDQLKVQKAEFDSKVKALDEKKLELVKQKGGFEIPATWFQSVNAVLIVILGPLFVWIWAKRSGKFPSSPVKFAMGLLFAGLGSLLLVPAARIVQGTPGTITPVNMSWLIGVYFIHTIGELSLSPVGLSYVSRLAPKHLTSQLMGAWFFSLGIGAYLAGKAAGFMDSVPLWQIFAFGAITTIAMSLLLWLVVSRIIHKLMGGHS